jgi:hypothetical protein
LPIRKNPLLSSHGKLLAVSVSFGKAGSNSGLPLPTYIVFSIKQYVFPASAAKNLKSNLSKSIDFSIIFLIFKNLKNMEN